MTAPYSGFNEDSSSFMAIRWVFQYALRSLLVTLLSSLSFSPGTVPRYGIQVMKAVFAAASLSAPVLLSAELFFRKSNGLSTKSKRSSAAVIASRHGRLAPLGCSLFSFRQLDSRGSSLSRRYAGP